MKYVSLYLTNAKLYSITFNTDSPSSMGDLTFTELSKTGEYYALTATNSPQFFKIAPIGEEFNKVNPYDLNGDFNQFEIENCFFTDMNGFLGRLNLTSDAEGTEVDYITVNTLEEDSDYLNKRGLSVFYSTLQSKLLNFVRKTGDTMSGSLSIGTNNNNDGTRSLCVGGGGWSTNPGEGPEYSPNYNMSINTFVSGASSGAIGSNSFAAGNGVLAAGIASAATGIGAFGLINISCVNYNNHIYTWHTEDFTPSVGSYIIAPSPWTSAGSPTLQKIVSINTAQQQFTLEDSLERSSSYALDHKDVFYADETSSNLALGIGSHTEGAYCKALGGASHAEGGYTQTSQSYCHSEGNYTIASALGAHAEGVDTQATGKYSHAEGQNTIADGYYSHAEGGVPSSITIKLTGGANATTYTTTSTNKAKVGDKVYAYSDFSLPHMCSTITAIVENTSITVDKTLSSSAVSNKNFYLFQISAALAHYSHVEGQGNTASGVSSHAEGTRNIASGTESHAEGNSTSAEAIADHSEGMGTWAHGGHSHTEGQNTQASHYDSHAEGRGARAHGLASHAEGENTRSHGVASHAEGRAVGVSYRDTWNPFIIHVNATANSKTLNFSSSSYNTDHTFSELSVGCFVQYSISGNLARITALDSTNSIITIERAISTSAISNASNVIYFPAVEDGAGTFGTGSHTEGYKTIAEGDYSHAEGEGTKTYSLAQHTQGRYNIVDQTGKMDALGTYVNIVGNGTSTSNRSNAYTLDWSGNAWYAGDVYTGSTSGTNKDNGSKKLATEDYVTSQGYVTTDTKNTAGSIDTSNKIYLIGAESQAANPQTYSDNEVFVKDGVLNAQELTIGSRDGSNSTIGANSVVIGTNNIASGEGSCAEGILTTASGYNSHAEGGQTTASASYSHAEGLSSVAEGNWSHAEGCFTAANNAGAHAENGYHAARTIIITGNANATTYTTTNTNGAKVGQYLKYKNEIRKITALVENTSITVETTFSNNQITSQPANLMSTTASGQSSHAEGRDTLASGACSHAEGSDTQATNGSSHAEGTNTTASGLYSHAEGEYTTASSGAAPHAEGSHTTATGTASHAEGSYTNITGNYGHGEGQGTKSTNRSQHVQGEYNIHDNSGNNINRGTYAHIVGNGTADNARSNAHTLDWSGNAWYAGDVYVGSTSGTNKDSGSKKLATENYVDTAINSLPEPMIFKGSLGTGGTITALPVNGTANIGDTYKVITAGTYASQAAKVGDTFICLTKTSNANTWELIPSGDEPSGTVTSITIQGTSPIVSSSSSAITTSGTRTISHATSGVSAGTYKSVTVDTYGHVTGGTNPTTISGYGITDAKINSGTITLGSNTITPLTSASTLDATKLNGTVPSGCYTNTKNTAGSTDTSNKIYLVGATSQTASSQTYSDDEVYTTSGTLTAKEFSLGTNAKIVYNTNESCIEFNFS